MPQNPSLSDWNSAKPISQSEWDQAKPVSAATPQASLPQLPENELITGALKGLGNTAVGLAELVNKIPGVSDAIDRFYGVPDFSKRMFSQAHDVLEPSNATQQVGKFAEQTGEFFVPTGFVGKLGKAAEIIKNAGLSAAQSDSPTAGLISGGLTALLPGPAKKAAGALEDSAEKSMIRAMGPPGGRGPTGASNLAKAEELAPTLVKAGFSPRSQAQAAEMSYRAISKAGSQLKDVLEEFGSATTDKSKILQAIDAKRAALLTPKEGGGGFLDPANAAADALWKELRTSVEQVESTAGGLHKLKEAWNTAVKGWGTDPAKGSEKAIYKAGGDLIRAHLRGNAPEIAEADKLFSFAKRLNEVVTAANVRRPGAGISEFMMPLARPTVGAAVGGAEGYRQGGLTGAVAGAIVGGSLGSLVQSPGFRYLSANMKQRLADALDRGDARAITSLVSVMTSQAAALARSKGEQ